MRVPMPKLKDYLLCTYSASDKYKMNTIYRITEENEADPKVFKVLNHQGIAQWINLEGLTYQFKPMEVVAMENPLLDMDAFIAGAREYEQLCVATAGSKTHKIGSHCHQTTLHSNYEQMKHNAAVMHANIIEATNKKRLTDSETQSTVHSNNVARTMIDSLLDQLKAGEMSPAAIAVALQNIKKEIA